jgi:hypothetical protein
VQNINTDPNQQEAIAAFVNAYATTVSVDDLCNEGIVLTDLGGHKVAPAYGEVRAAVIHTGKPYAEIMVIYLKGGIPAGWVRSESMMDASDRWMVPVTALNRMPDSFNFVQECPHMSVYGGVYTEDRDGWECLGCSKTIIVR